MERARAYIITFIIFIVSDAYSNPIIQQIDQYISTLNISKSKMMVVFDIDDTILSNKDPIESHNDFSIPHLIAYQHRASLTKIQETKEVYDWLNYNNIKVTFITFRCEIHRLSTIKNLYEQGFRNWDSLIMYGEPCNYAITKAVDFKRNERKKLSLNGFHIVAAIGDQYSDLKGGYTDLFFKLKDPGYFTE